MVYWAGLVAILYAVTAVLFLRVQFHQGKLKAALGLMLGAFVIHGVSLALEMFWQGGVDFSILKMMSLTALLLSLLSLIWIWKGYVPLSGTVVCSINSFVVLLPYAFESSLLFSPSVGRGVMLHVLLSVAAFIAISFALLHGILYLWFYNRLKRKRLMPHSGVALVAVGRQMNVFSAVTFVLLGLSLLTGFIYVEDFFAQHLLHKTVFSVAAWLVLAVQMWQCFVRGKCGLAVFWLLLVAFFLLFLGYVVSSVILELILQRR